MKVNSLDGLAAVQRVLRERRRRAEEEAARRAAEEAARRAFAVNPSNPRVLREKQIVDTWSERIKA